MATVGENRALRDQYNILLRELRALQEQYNRDRPGIGQDPGRDITTFRDIDNKTNSVLFRMEQLQAQNAQNPNLFDPQLAQGIEQNVRAGRDVITASQQVVRQAEQQLQTQTNNKAQTDQGPGTVSTGETASASQQANDNNSDIQSPAAAPESAGATGVVQPTNPVTLPSNAEPSVDPAATSVPAPSTLPAGSVGAPGTGTAPTLTAQGSQSPAPARQSSSPNLEVPDENTNRVSYIYRAYEVTSVFRQGKFMQDIQGAQIFFNLPPQQQKNPDLGRTAQDQQAASAARSTRQGTVNKTTLTPGVPIAAAPAPGLLEQEGFGDPTVAPTYVASQSPTIPPAPLPGSSFELEGFSDPTSISPLASAPPTSGTSPTTAATIAPQPAANKTTTQVTQGESYVTPLNDQLKLARLNKAQFEKALADVDARIARGEGNPVNNREMRRLYSDNLRFELNQIATLEQKLAQNPPSSGSSNTNVAPQQGAREY